MPDPTAHAADMTSPANPEPMPRFWWLNPWSEAIAWHRRAENGFATHMKTCDELREAHIDRSKLQQTKHELHALLGNAKADHNAFQRQVEVTLEPVLSPDGYNDTIELVHWAADEIKRLRASLSVITEDRDAYIDKVEKLRAELLEAKDNVLSLVAGNEQAEDDMTKAEARIKQLTMFCERAGAERDREKEKVEQITLMCNERDRTISALEIDVESLSRQLRAAKRKLSKAEKAKPLLWEDKTKTLTHGVNFTLGNHEDRHDPVREAYASLGRKFIKAGIKAQAKAKKKGGRRA